MRRLRIENATKRCWTAGKRCGGAVEFLELVVWGFSSSPLGFSLLPFRFTPSPFVFSPSPLGLSPHENIGGVTSQRSGVVGGI